MKTLNFRNAKDMKYSSVLSATARSLKRGFLALTAAVLISTVAGCGQQQDWHECERDSYRCVDSSLEVCSTAGDASYWMSAATPACFQDYSGRRSVYDYHICNGNTIFSCEERREINFDCNYVGETWQYSAANSREECEQISAEHNGHNSCSSLYMNPILLGSQWVSTTFRNVREGLKALILNFSGGSHYRDSRNDVQVDELHSRELRVNSCGSECLQIAFLDDELIAEATRRNIADDGEVKVIITTRDDRYAEFSLIGMLARFCYDQPIE